jgi:class 3 adenylate cyclase
VAPVTNAGLAVLGGLLLVSLLVLALVTARWRDALRRVADLEAEVEALTAPDPGLHLPRSLQAAERAAKTVIGTAVKVREQGVGGLLMGSIDDLSRWAMEDRGEIARLAALDGTVTVFFSDIEGSTAINAALGDAGWVRLLIAHDTQVRAHVERRNGHIVKSQGDGFMVVFGSPVDAVRAGLGIQRSLADLRSGWLRRTPLTVRIGIHEGTAIARNGDLFGQTVATAARVGAQAQGDEILVTRPVAEALADDPRLELTERPAVTLKGLPGTHVLWRVDRAARR